MTATGNAENLLRASAVIGAGGKMGTGIAWVALKAMADLDARENGMPGSGRSELVLIDSNPASFRRLREYLREQLVKAAERDIAKLRNRARNRADLIENGEIIAAYADGAMSMVRCETGLEGARTAGLVFEAVFEDLEIKKTLYGRLKALCRPEAFFLTNTSSIPISILDKSAGLEGRILGFHFYNPPAVQKLVEVISGKDTRRELVALGRELGEVFGKISVPANDVAGFIGNGHFIREGLFALRVFREMRWTHGDAKALRLIDSATRDFLIRPMGIFQLMDYVGLDVFLMIVKVMREHGGEVGLERDPGGAGLLDGLLAAGIRGGQEGSGEQRDGLFRYSKNNIEGVYDFKEGAYISLSDPKRFPPGLDWLGRLPDGHVPWSALVKDPGRKEKLDAYFSRLSGSTTQGARLAREFLGHSRRVGEDLVRTGVAACGEDVSRVLVHGFYHLYGPADWTH